MYNATDVFLFGTEIFQDPNLKAYRKQYALINVVVGIVFLIASVVWYALSKSSYFFATFEIFFQIIIVFFVYFHYHSLVRQLKEKSDWKNDAVSSLTVDLSDERKDFISSTWLLMFPIMIAITVILGLVFYSKMPQQVPIHYDIAGNVNRYAQKSYGLIFFAPLMQVLMSLLFSFIFFMVKSRRRRIDPSNEDDSRRKQNVFRRSMGFFAIVGGLLTQLTFACIQLNIVGILSSTSSLLITGILPAILCIYAVWIGVKVGQGGSRMKNMNPSADKPNIKDADNYWKLGMFYYNPDDPTIFLEKRFGIGYTINFGRPMAYLFVLGLIAFMALTIIISTLMTK